MHLAKGMLRSLATMVFLVVVDLLISVSSESIVVKPPEAETSQAELSSAIAATATTSSHRSSAYTSDRLSVAPAPPLACVQAVGHTDCANGAACPLGYQCASTKKGAGLRGLCEPDRCKGEYGEQTRGGPLNHTCFGERLNGTLICGEESRSELANAFRVALPFECLEDILENLGFECEIEALDVGIRYGVDLEGMCQEPARARLFIDTIPPLGEQEIYADLGQTIYQELYGMYLFGVQAYAVGRTSGTINALTLRLGLDACLDVWPLPQLCGADIPGSDGYLPYFVVEGTFNFGAGCGSPAPSPAFTVTGGAAEGPRGKYVKRTIR